MTTPGEPIGPVDRLIQLDKFTSKGNAERWCKSLSPAFPAADYWLCHESRIFQEFQRDQRHAARFIAVDTDRRLLVCEAEGHPLTHWLATRVGSQDHPFQHSSELIRLILASLRALEHLQRRSIVHAGIRPDNIVLKLNSVGEFDYESFRFIDFSYAHSPQNRIEKPLFIDLDSPDAASLAPWMKDSLRRDWRSFARVAGDHEKSSWYELSALARRQYEAVMLPELSVNQLDWRVDLFSLGYWFRQISLHRIDYFNDKHQEALPRLLKRMQKPLTSGGFLSVSAAIHAFEALELEARPVRIDQLPQTTRVQTMHPVPVLHVSESGEIDFAPLPVSPSDTSVDRPALPLAWIGGGLVAVVAGAITWGLVRHQPDQPSVELSQPVVAAPATTEAKPEKAPEITPPLPATPAPAPVVDATSVPVATPSAEPMAAVGAETKTLDESSIEQIRSAADKGDARAQTLLGLRYRNGQGVTVDNEEAVKWYNKAAHQNYAEAQAYLGFMLMTGRGVKKDDAQAVSWLRKAAAQGNGLGQYNLGLMVLNGRGSKQDVVEAYKWFLLANKTQPSAKVRLQELKPRLSAVELKRAEAMANEAQ